MSEKLEECLGARLATSHAPAMLTKLKSFNPGELMANRKGLKDVEHVSCSNVHAYNEHGCTFMGLQKKAIEKS